MEDKGETLVKVQYEGLPDDADYTWEPLRNLTEDLPGMLEDFLHTSGDRKLKRQATSARPGLFSIELLCVGDLELLGPCTTLRRAVALRRSQLVEAPRRQGRSVLHEAIGCVKARDVERGQDSVTSGTLVARQKAQCCETESGPCQPFVSRAKRKATTARDS